MVGVKCGKATIATTVAFALLGVLAACDSSVPVTRSRDRPESTTRPATMQVVVSTTTLPPLRSGARPCPASALTATIDHENDPTMQQPSAFFTVTNRSATVCQVAGYPLVVLYDSHAKPIGGMASPGSAFEINDPGPADVELAPGERAFFGLGWTDVNHTDGGSTQGCRLAVGAGVAVPGSSKPVWVPAVLRSPVCGSPSVTALALPPAFNISHP